MTPWPASPEPIELSNRATVERLGGAPVSGLPPTDPGCSRAQDHTCRSASGYRGLGERPRVPRLAPGPRPGRHPGPDPQAARAQGPSQAAPHRPPGGRGRARLPARARRHRDVRPGVPGPGIATILLGLFLLALEFERAERLLERAIVGRARGGARSAPPPPSAWRGRSSAYSRSRRSRGRDPLEYPAAAGPLAGPRCAAAQRAAGRGDRHIRRARVTEGATAQWDALARCATTAGRSWRPRRGRLPRRRFVEDAAVVRAASRAHPPGSWTARRGGVGGRGARPAGPDTRSWPATLDGGGVARRHRLRRPRAGPTRRARPARRDGRRAGAQQGADLEVGSALPRGVGYWEALENLPLEFVPRRRRRRGGRRRAGAARRRRSAAAGSCPWRFEGKRTPAALGQAGLAPPPMRRVSISDPSSPTTPKTPRASARACSASARASGPSGPVRPCTSCRPVSRSAPTTTSTARRSGCSSSLAGRRCATRGHRAARALRRRLLPHGPRRRPPDPQRHRRDRRVLMWGMVVVPTATAYPDSDKVASGPATRPRT